MLSNGDTVDNKKANGICSANFAVHYFSRFLLDPSLFCIKDSRST